MHSIESASPKAPHVEESGWWSKISTGLSSQIAELARKIRAPNESEPILCHRLDPLLYKNALTILNLSLDDVKNPSIVIDTHMRLITILKTKQQQVPELLAREIGLMIKDANTAYRTIIEQRESL